MIWGSSSVNTPALTDAQILTLVNEPIVNIDTGVTGGTAITPSKLAGSPTLNSGQGISWNGTDAWVATDFVKTTDAVTIPSNSISMDKLSKGSSETIAFDNQYIGWDNTNSKFVPRSGANVDLAPYDGTQGHLGLTVPSMPFAAAVPPGATQLTTSAGRAYYMRGYASRAISVSKMACILISSSGSGTLEMALLDAALTTKIRSATIGLTATSSGYQSVSFSSYTIPAGPFYAAFLSTVGTSPVSVSGGNSALWVAFCGDPNTANGLYASGGLSSTDVSSGKFDAAGTITSTDAAGSWTSIPIYSSITGANQKLSGRNSAYPLLFIQ